MKTPICDFINKYNQSGASRLHMPGHKGVAHLGFEKYDITEIDGADSLYKASGIIEESEKNATLLFESGKTLYSCEGSSLSVRAMLYLAKAYYMSQIETKKTRTYVLATRNAHSSFVSASVLLDFDIKWLYPDTSNYICGKINAQKIEKTLSCVDNLPFAVYVTSPDYLGNICDIEAISKVCKRYNVPLLVDNAHGAYLKFLGKTEHPIDLGATLCCDSAHKTLPVLTGGAYLHISKDAPEFFKENSKDALALFGSTSPSYLILASLDNANKYINDGLSLKLNALAIKLDKLKAELSCAGYSIIGDEKLKLTISTKPYGYTGNELYSELKSRGIICEFYDPDFVVMMFTPDNECDIKLTKKALLDIPKRQAILDTPPCFSPCEQVLSTKNACFSRRKLLGIDNVEGEVLSTSNITCPPAISIVVAGEKFNKCSIELCKYYGITECYVVEK